MEEEAVLVVEVTVVIVTLVNVTVDATVNVVDVKVAVST